jgi:hypothetical protein
VLIVATSKRHAAEVVHGAGFGGVSMSDSELRMVFGADMHPTTAVLLEFVEAVPAASRTPLVNSGATVTC